MHTFLVKYIVDIEYFDYIISNSNSIYRNIMDKLINDQYQKRIQFFENSTKAKEKLIQRFSFGS